ncbi:ABC-type branched-chain amino acid transport system, periplasmic component [Opitutaceae bacterium TAV1]|nr:ABC-type branched-chain amino acid transport system, periplasmic component [Opitutaceae bacterium TAV1]
MLAALSVIGCSKRPDDSAVSIGLNVELTGEIPSVGASSRNAVELYVGQINAAGGITLAGKKVPVRLVTGDNGGKPDLAAATAQRLISRENVLVMIGPNASSCAIPASGIAESLRTPMISPWSTNPKTTIDPATGTPRSYVLRACFTDTFQAGVLAKFTLGELKATRAAVLFDIASEAPNGQANLYRETFEKNGGTITAFETYTTGDRDFSAQLTKIRASGPEVIYLPAYYTDVPLIARQARQLGITARLVGSDAWSSPGIIKLGGDALEGAYFCNHYSTQIATPAAQKFMADYEARYGQAPDDVAALSYDAAGFVLKAIESAGVADREAVRKAMASIPRYEGVTGVMQFAEGSGDPVKSAVILQIRDGRFAWVANATP